jgi:hypothetical protein
VAKYGMRNPYIREPLSDYFETHGGGPGVVCRRHNNGSSI